MTTFKELALAEPLLKALDDAGYTTPTPIQAQAIPPVMRGADLLGIAQTGTGKTAAFALPILHRLAADPRPAYRKGCRALVLSPTRELASQIAESFRTYGRHLGIRVAVMFGGVAHRPQIDAMARGVDVLVATPGRLLDHMAGRAVLLDATEILVLDEADQMLDLGFVKPIRQIIGYLPRQRQSLFFSATMPREIAALASELLKEPVRVAVTPVATTAERVSQRVIHIEQKRKRALLAELLSDAAMTRALVFTRTKRGADRVAEHLEGAGLTVAAIHGNKSQNQRERALEAFRHGKIRILVATDIAARGIDIDEVSHVINFELPEVPEAYVHRIGRTARAGAAGIAIALCDPEERDLLQAIERLTRQSIPAEDRRNDQALSIEPGARVTRRDERGGRGRGGDRGRGGERPERPASHGRGEQRRQPGGRDGGWRGGRDAPRGDRRSSHQSARAERHEREEVWSNHAAPAEERRSSEFRPSDRRSQDAPRGERRPADARPHGQMARRDDRRPHHRDGTPAHADQRREAPRRSENAGRQDQGRARPRGGRDGHVDRDRHRGART